MTSHSLNDADAAFTDRLAAELPDDSLRPAEARYLEEPRGRYAGQPATVALPRSAQQVAAIVRCAAEHRVPLVPYGGGTGLVGGQI